MGTARRTYEKECLTRAGVELDFSMNFTTGNAPTVIAQGNCVSVTRTGPGAYTAQLLDAGGKPMAPGYPIELPHHFHFTNGSTADVRWGNYNPATGQLTFTIHADKAAATVAADPASAANLNLRVRLSFKNSSQAKN